MNRFLLFLIIICGAWVKSWAGAIYSPENKSAVIYYRTDPETVHTKLCDRVSESEVKKIMEELKTSPYTFNQTNCKSISGAEVINRSSVERNLSPMKKELARAFALSNKGTPESLTPEDGDKESSDYFKFLTPVQRAEVKILSTDKLLEAVVDQAKDPSIKMVGANKLREEVKGLIKLAK